MKYPIESIYPYDAGIILRQEAGERESGPRAYKRKGGVKMIRAMRKRIRYLVRQAAARELMRISLMALMLMAMPLARAQVGTYNTGMNGWTESQVANYFGRPANIIRSVTAVDSCYPLNCDIIVEQWVYHPCDIRKRKG